MWFPFGTIANYHSSNLGDPNSLFSRRIELRVDILNGENDYSTSKL